MDRKVPQQRAATSGDLLASIPRSGSCSSPYCSADAIGDFFFRNKTE